MNASPAAGQSRLADFYLASGSPRRRELLAQLGYRFEVLRLEVGEYRRPAEEAAAMVQRLALAKALAGWSVVEHRAPRPVLGADTEVVLDGRALGKPASREDALIMLGSLSGRVHSVLTGVALVRGAEHAVLHSETLVFMRVIEGDELKNYCDCGEGNDKAGGYAIQGRGAMFVQRIEGSYSGVVGLPLFETVQLLARFGVPCLQSEKQSR